MQDGEIILQDEGTRNVHKRPFLNHNNKGKGQVMMVSVSANAPQAVEGEPNLDKMAEKLQHLHKFTLLRLGGLQFCSKGSTKSIIKLTDLVESCELIEGRSKRRSRFDDDVVVFYNNDWRGLTTTHNRPLS